jgi:hypothetical protein
MKVKHILIVVSEEDYAKFKTKKGKRTWLGVLQQGLNSKPQDRQE